MTTPYHSYLEYDRAKKVKEQLYEKERIEGVLSENDRFMLNEIINRMSAFFPPTPITKQWDKSLPL